MRDLHQSAGIHPIPISQQLETPLGNVEVSPHTCNQATVCQGFYYSLDSAAGHVKGSHQVRPGGCPKLRHKGEEPIFPCTPQIHQVGTLSDGRSLGVADRPGLRRPIPQSPLVVACLCRPDQGAGRVHSPHLHVVAVGGPRPKRRKFVQANGGDGRFYIPPDGIFGVAGRANELGANLGFGRNESRELRGLACETHRGPETS